MYSRCRFCSVKLFFLWMALLLFAVSCKTRTTSLHTSTEPSYETVVDTLVTDRAGDTLSLDKREEQPTSVTDSVQMTSIKSGEEKRREIIVSDSVPPSDTPDVIQQDSITQTSNELIKEKVALEAIASTTEEVEVVEDSLQTATEEPIVLEDIVNFSAQDSVVLLGQNKVYFFGPSKVSYQRMNLESNFMYINTDSSQVYAQYTLDEEGHPMAYPTFSEGDQKFESKTMLYNFRTEKGYITGALTQQGEGFLTSEESMRMPDNTMFVKGGRYTTCDNHDDPHFYIRLTRAKVVPEKNIVTGPAYMVMGGVPLYLIGLPFGFFPFNEKRTSGIILPSYGDELDRGFYFRGGGFYYAINDYVDLKVVGDIYTLGSWGVSASSNYVRRYKYSGNVNVSFVSTVRGDKKIPGDYSNSKDFSINWSHTQDRKVDPLRTFSASVNFSTSSYNHNSINTMYNPDVRAQNTKGSSISYSRRFNSIPLNITAAMNIDQRSSDSTLSVSLPNLSVSLSTIYPFKRKKRVGKERWYEKISLNYSGSFRNSIVTKEDKILQSNLIRDWNNGMQHRIPVSASFDLFDYIKVTPSFNYNARWYTRKIGRRWDDATGRVIDADTTFGFYHIHDCSASLSTSTTLYGFFKPWKIFGDKVQMIRHRVTPSVSFSYTPDFGDPSLGYYKKLHYKDKNGVDREEIYSPFRRNMFGVPGRDKSGYINFNFANNLEMKLRDNRDTVGEGFKKISLIDQFDWNIGYNMMADSFKWTNINATLALRLSEKFVLRLNGTFDTYLYDYSIDESGRVIPRRVDKLRIFNGKGFGRLIGTGTGFSYTFNNQTGKKIAAFIDKLLNKNKEEEVTSDMSNKTDTPDSNQPALPSKEAVDKSSRSFGRRGSSSPFGDQEVDDDGYLVWNFPWNFSFNYSMNLGYDHANFDIHKKEYRYKLTHNLSFRGDIKPTKNWAFMFDANYNFDLKKVTNMTISVTRDLHCWQLTASIIPIGYYKSYSVTIGVKSSLLKDLKYQQTSIYTGGARNTWY